MGAYSEVGDCLGHYGTCITTQRYISDNPLLWTIGFAQYLTEQPDTVDHTSTVYIHWWYELALALVLHSCSGTQSHT